MSGLPEQEPRLFFDSVNRFSWDIFDWMLDGYASFLGWMLELVVAPFCCYQIPAISFQHLNDLP